MILCANHATPLNSCVNCPYLVCGLSGAPLQGTPSSGIRQPFNEKKLSHQNTKSVDTKPKVVSAKYWKMICGAHKQLPVVQLPLVELVCYHHRENCILMFLLAHLLHDDLPLAAFHHGESGRAVLNVLCSIDWTRRSRDESAHCAKNDQCAIDIKSQPQVAFSAQVLCTIVQTGRSS